MEVWFTLKMFILSRFRHSRRISPPSQIVRVRLMVSIRVRDRVRVRVRMRRRQRDW